MAFEETERELTQNVASFRFDLEKLQSETENLPSITSSSSEARLRRPANATLRDYLSDWAVPLTPSKQRELCAILLNELSRVTATGQVDQQSVSTRVVTTRPAHGVSRVMASPRHWLRCWWNAGYE
jgi:hypothetical protein